MSKKLLIFNHAQGPGTIDLSPESNSWYLKNYESYFDEVQHLSLMGKNKEAVINGKSGYYFRGTGNTVKDLLLSPFRLYKYVKKYNPDFIITYDQLWSWWTIVFVRLFTKTRTYLVPMTFPEQIYKVTGKAISGRLPIWLERILLGLTYRSCYKVITSFNLGNYINWMQGNHIINKKLIIVDSLPESVIFPAFMKRLNEISGKVQSRNFRNGGIKLIYVGRLHSEKMTDHLVKAISIVRESIPDVNLIVIGQGPDKDNLVSLAKQLGVDDIVKFQDYVTHSHLPDYLLLADIFVSPCTGHAFREAAMCGLPIVAYNIDWIKGFLISGKNFFGVEYLDYKKFANGIIDVAKDSDFREKLSVNVKSFAERYWSSNNLQLSLLKIFG